MTHADQRPSPRTGGALSRSATSEGGGSARGYALVASAAVLWGSWSLFLRRTTIDARWTTPIVFVAMTLFGAPLLLRPGGRGTSPRSMRDARGLVVLGVSDAANAWLFFGAMAHTTLAIAVLSHYLAPVLVSLAAPRWLGTPPQRGAIPRALIATAGLLLVLQPWHLRGLEPRHLVGAMFGAGSAVFYAANVFLSKQVSVRYTAEETLVYHSFVSALVVLPFAPWGALPTLSSVGIVALAGVAIGITAGVCFVRGVSRIPAEHASILTFVEPITAVFLGVIVFGERLNALAYVGAAVVLATGAVSARSR